jgi:hypothetical protein
MTQFHVALFRGIDDPTPYTTIPITAKMPLGALVFALKRLQVTRVARARLRAAPDFNLLVTPEQRSGQTDLYEALGGSAEEEGDAHAQAWARLQRLATTGKAKQEAIDYERTIALTAWQSAANYYRDGLRIGETLALSEGLKRIKQKRLRCSAEQPW